MIYAQAIVDISSSKNTSRDIIKPFLQKLRESVNYLK
jgi:hypothetical protein